jgi:UDP-N-acetylglucosamine acyltransferase
MSRIVQDVPPFMLVEGNPARARSVNTVGLERNRFEPQAIEQLKDAFKRLFRGTATNGAEAIGNTAETIDQLRTDYPDSEVVSILCQFIRNKSIGIGGRFKETLRHDLRRTGSQGT